nr:ankyrin repeat domain-containing protein SOWAHC-like [Leptinotarsa decemlineata]
MVMEEENRQRFKTFVNKIATTRLEGDEKILVLKPKYTSTSNPPPSPSFSPLTYPPHCDPRNSIGIPVSPSHSLNESLVSSSPRQPPPYRPPPPVNASSNSLDTLSMDSMSSLGDAPPQVPPRERRRDSDRSKSVVDESTPKKANIEPSPNEDVQTVSVKERTQKFNRLASVDDELSPRQPKSAEKENRRPNWGADEDDSASVIPLEPKKCMEWYVTASKGDYQELLRLANSEPRLVNKKDPFTAYTVLHWGAKYGNADIIKIFAGKYKVDVNGKTNGGYTPLHISAQFGHKELFKLLIEVYKADPNIRDYSGRTAEYYLLVKEHKQGPGITLRSEYTRDSLRHEKSRSKSFRHKTISLPTPVIVNSTFLFETNKRSATAK